MSTTDDLLKRLHERLLQTLLERLEGGEEIKPADLEVARKFLLDNGVDADKRRSQDLGRLQKSVVANLPFTSDEMERLPFKGRA